MTKHFEPMPLPELIPVMPPDDFAEKQGVWLAKTEQSGDLGDTVYALIHLDDGVLWGRVEQSKLHIPVAKDRNGQSLDSYLNSWIPKLRTLTIQQCRLFGSKGELFIWRIAEGQWCGRKVLDRLGTRIIPEKQILIGNQVVADLADGFTAIREKSTGLRQIVPRLASVPANMELVDEDRRVALIVHHYLSEDEDGQALIKCSRLVGLEECDLTTEVHDDDRQ